MEKRVELQGRTVAYKFKVSTRAKHVRLTVYPGGALVVTVPRTMSERVVEKFIITKSKWVFTQLKRSSNLPAVPPKVRHTKAEREKYIVQAQKLAEHRLAHFNQAYGFPFNAVRIKNQKTRWGSCSQKGNLNFNYRVALLPERLADYIVVHELCHLREMNHSPKFWKLVAETFPDHKELRAELRKSGLRFM